MDINESLKRLSQELAEIESGYAKLNEQLFGMETDVKKSLDHQNALNAKLKSLVAHKAANNGKHQGISVVQESNVQEHLPVHDDPTAQMEKLLQGTLDVLGDKISDRLMGMLKELKSIPVEMRASRIQEVKQAADAELVDLSGLYKHEHVQSNIEDVGVTESEAKGIDKNLEKLRQMRQAKNNP